MKRAELSMTVIVSAVIALLVLVVVGFIFLQNVKGPNEQFQSCALNGGRCVATGACTDGIELAGTSCEGDTPVCCQGQRFFE